MKSEYHEIGHENNSVIKYIKWWGENRNNIHFYHKIDGPAYIILWSNGIKDEYYYLLNHWIAEKDFFTPGFIDAFLLEHS